MIVKLRLAVDHPRERVYMLGRFFTKDAETSMDLDDVQVAALARRGIIQVGAKKKKDAEVTDA